jgi:glycerol-3-phosphate dehydrogenase (NAD(P)+)
MRIAIFGAGAWGTALARHAAMRHDVVLWARDPAQADDIAARRQNRRYLPGVALGESVTATADLREAALRGADLHVVATSVAGLGPVAGAIEQAVPAAAVPMLWLCKGLEAETALLPHQVVAQRRPGARSGVLSGPSFAQEVAAGLPVALTVASGDTTVCDAALAAFHHGAVRLYRGDDLVGVEVAGAVKNVMAIATGISDGLGLGLNARAALLTRGLAEIGRYGAALGARPETFMGLAGVGDLVLTCTGDLSRNRRVGLRIAEGESLQAVLASLGHVAEGVACCRAVLRSAAALGVDMPITAAVGAVLFEGRAPREMVAELLAREPRSEQQ